MLSRRCLATIRRNAYLLTFSHESSFVSASHHRTCLVLPPLHSRERHLALLSPPRRAFRATPPGAVEARDVKPEDAEVRLASRAEQLVRYSSVRKALESSGALAEDLASVNGLRTVVERLPSTSDAEAPFALLMRCCADGTGAADDGDDYLALSRRLREISASNGAAPHFAFDLGFLHALANSLERRPELDDELCDRIRLFFEQHHFSLAATEVCKELVNVVARSSIWREAFPLLGRLNSRGDSSWSDFLPMLVAAAKEGDLDVVLLLQNSHLESVQPRESLDLLYEDRSVGTEQVWKLVMDTLLQQQTNRDERSRINMEKVLSHWRKTGYIPHADVAKKLAVWFLTFHGESANRFVHGSIKMPKSGVCPLSGKTLERLQLLRFDEIKEKFLSEVLIGANVYDKSDPEEVESVQRFVRAEGPFDLVIDGLNLCYRQSHAANKTSISTKMQRVLKVVKHFSEKSEKRVAVIARDWWNRRDHARVVKEMRNHAKIFMTKEMTQDDLFTIFCCFESGVDCFLLSNDLFRDTKAAFNPDLRAAFAHWQHARQIHVSLDDAETRMTLVAPRQYSTRVQEIDGTLFVPHHRVSESELKEDKIGQDLNCATSLDRNLRIPDSFLVVDPEWKEEGEEKRRTFFIHYPLGGKESERKEREREMDGEDRSAEDEAERRQVEIELN